MTIAYLIFPDIYIYIHIHIHTHDVLRIPNLFPTEAVTGPSEFSKVAALYVFKPHPGAMSKCRGVCACVRNSSWQLLRQRQIEFLAGASRN